MKQNMDFWVHYKWRLNLKILLKILCKCPMAHSLHICKKVSFLLLYVAPLEYENTRPMNLALNFESRKEKKSIVRLLFRKIGRANLWGENMRLIIWIYGYLAILILVHNWLLKMAAAAEVLNALWAYLFVSNF